jgi:hypothetical protein
MIKIVHAVQALTFMVTYFWCSSFFILVEISAVLNIAGAL